MSIRVAGSKLAFIDIYEGRGSKLQIVLDYGVLEKAPGTDFAAFNHLRRLIRRGDIICTRNLLG